MSFWASAKDADAHCRSLERIAGAIFRIHELNARTTFEIFIHKIDGMSETYRQGSHSYAFLRVARLICATITDIQLEVSSRIKDELDDLAEAELGSTGDYTFPIVNYHFTSIYQSNVYEALSKVISRLMPCQGPLERLLDMLYQNTNFEKAYLFDLASKLYFATDSTPGDPSTHEICTEYIDLHWEMDQIYAKVCSRTIARNISNTSLHRPEMSEGDTETSVSLDEVERSPSQPNGHAPKLRRSVRSSFSGSVALANGTALCHWELAEYVSMLSAETLGRPDDAAETLQSSPEATQRHSQSLPRS